jgi:hypothetical protein
MNAADMRLAANAVAVHACSMTNKREPIDDMIGAYVWMRRQEARAALRRAFS